MRVVGIDPGTTESAYVTLDEQGNVRLASTAPNNDVARFVQDLATNDPRSVLAIEHFQAMGQTVGQEVFTTCKWIGRFCEIWERTRLLADPPCAQVVEVFRSQVKMLVCQDPRAKDGNIRAALIEAYGGKGVEKKGGALAGVTGDAWSALAVAQVAAHRLKLPSRRIKWAMQEGEVSK